MNDGGGMEMIYGYIYREIIAMRRMIVVKIFDKF